MTDHESSAAILAWRDQEDRHVTGIIRKYGCYLQYVPGDENDPSFAYTVGLFGLGHPELIVFSLRAGGSAAVLNRLFDQIRGGDDLTPGQILSLPDANVKFLVEDFPEPGATLFGANRHYQRPSEASVPAYQLTWSADGFFPGEPGYRLGPNVQPGPAHSGPTGAEVAQPRSDQLLLRSRDFN